MATQLKCQTLYPEGLVEIALSAPDTVALTVEKELLACRLDMTQRHLRISRLGAWLVQYTFEGGRGIIRFTALDKAAPQMQVRFLKGSASLTLRSGSAVHDLQAAGLDVEMDSVTVLQEISAKKPPLPTPKPSADMQKLQKRVAELEKLAALKIDQLREEMQKKNADLCALNASAAEEVERLEDQLAQAQRLQAVQEGELSAAKDALTKAQSACEEQQRQITQLTGDTASLEEQIESLQQKALARAQMTQDLTEADIAALQELLREQRQEYLAMTEALALLSADPVIGCKTVSGLLEESSARLEEAQKRIAAIITLREKINDDVMIAVTGRGKLPVKAEAGEG